MGDESGERDPRFVILDGVRTEQRRQAATDRLYHPVEGPADREDPRGPQDRAALVRQIEALEVLAGICAVQTRAAQATGSVDRWHRITAQVEGELAALRRHLDLADSSG